MNERDAASVRTEALRSGGLPSDGWIRALAPAKVNLWLDVLGKRSDGFHEIRTWMLALDLADRIAVRKRERAGVSLVVSGPAASADIPCDSENLVARAVLAVLEEARHSTGATCGFDLQLEKRIPSQAGLGGGSSDAAAAWLAAERALGIELAARVRERGLSRLGSDCVFFASAASTGLAVCEGRGDRVVALPPCTHDWSVAILTPDAHAPTRDVYRALPTPLSASPEQHSLRDRWFELPARSARSLFFNRLEDVALEALPLLRPWRRLLDECGADHFRLAGSGASFFGVFDDPVEADQILQRIDLLARARAMKLRGAWVTRPSLGARLVEVS